MRVMVGRSGANAAGNAARIAEREAASGGTVILVVVRSAMKTAMMAMTKTVRVWRSNSAG